MSKSKSKNKAPATKVKETVVEVPAEETVETPVVEVVEVTKEEVEAGAADADVLTEVTEPDVETVTEESAEDAPVPSTEASDDAEFNEAEQEAYNGMVGRGVHPKVATKSVLARR